MEGSVFQANATETVTSLVTSVVTVIANSSSTSGDPKASGQPSSQKPIIIGSVVGGISAAGVIGFALVFILRRRKTKKHQDNELSKSGSEDGSKIRPQLPDTTYVELEAKACHTQIEGHEILEAPANLNQMKLDPVSEIGGSEVFEAPSGVPGRQDIRTVQ